MYDVQDLWPESALASGLMRPGRLVDILYRLADWVYRRAPVLLVVSRAAADYLRGRGVDARKIVVASHWFDTTPFEAPVSRDVRAEFGWASRFVVMFAGNLGMVQGLETVVEAAALLQHRADIHFVLVGDGSDRPRLEGLIAERKLRNISFAGQHPASEMPAFFNAADALLVHLRQSHVADHAIPTKILAYMAAARPVVCGTGGAAAEVLDAADAGITTPAGDAAAMAAAIERLAASSPAERARLGANGRAYLHEHFDRSTIIDQYERLLVELGDRRMPQASTAAGQS